MARISFDTNNPVDVKLIEKLIGSGLIHEFESNGNGNGNGSNGNGQAPSCESMEEAVHLMLESVNDDTRMLVQEIALQTESGKSTTLQQLADALEVSYDSVKARRLNLGRTIKKVSARFPAASIILDSVWDSASKTTAYTMNDEARDAAMVWFAEHWGDDD